MTESSRTLYTLQNPAAVHDLHSEQGRLPFDRDPQLGEGGKLNEEGGKSERADLPPELATRLPTAGQRLSANSLRSEELATLLGKDLKYLRNKTLSDMVHSGQLSLRYPESPNQPHQAYVVPTDGGEANRG
jgi:hypothetical protein